MGGADGNAVELGCHVARTGADEEAVGEQWFLTPFSSNYGLSLADVYAALAYYYDHRQEIDEAILADESYVAELRSRTKSKLSGTISG